MPVTLSIIVPVYNTAGYLARCFDSLIKQSCVEQLEVIIVNDGSTDNSSEIIDNYVHNYPELFNSCIKSNGGLSDARNFGLNYVTGKYLAFLDSDDWVDSELYANCINFLDSHDDYDFVNFNHVEEWSAKVVIIDSKAKISRNKYFIPSYAWSKVFRSHFWHRYGFKFKFGIKYEDLELITKIIFFTRRYGFLDNIQAFYHYDCSRAQSITRSSRDCESWIIVLTSLIEFSKNKSDPDLIKFIATTLFYHLVLFGGNPDKSYCIYLDNREFFKADNIVSKPHKILKVLQNLHMDFLLKFIINLLYKLKIDPNNR